MSNQFDKIAALVRAEFNKTPLGLQTWPCLSLLDQLVGTLQAGTVPATDDRDRVIAGLKAELASLNSLANNTASIFQAIKDALRTPDATEGGLPSIVAGVVAERDALKTQTTRKGFGLQ